MQRVRNAEPLCGASRVHPVRTVGADRLRVMRVAPVVQMVREEVHAHPERADARELRGVRHLAVLQRVAMIGARIAREQRRHRVEHDLGRLVAVRMDMQLQSRAVKRREHVDELRGRNQPQPVRLAPA